MRNVSFVMVAVSALVFGGLGCAPAQESGSTTGTTDNTNESDLSGAKASSECTLDTLFMSNGFLTELKSSIGTSYIHNYGGQYYPHVEIPGFLDAALPTTDEFGNTLYTIVGFNFGAEDLPSGSTKKARFVATLEAGPGASASLPFAAKQYAAAKAIFTALTRATETTENHVAPHASYDRSWNKVTRASVGGHLVCTSTVYPDTGEARPTYSCSFYDFQRNMVQSFDVKDAGGKCLAK